MKKKITRDNYVKLSTTILNIIVCCSFMLSSRLASGTGGNPTDNKLPGAIALKVAELKQKHEFTSENKIFSVAGTTENRNEEIAKTVSNYTLLNVDKESSENILSSKPEYVKMDIPVDNGKRIFSLLLYKEDISPNGYTLLTSSGSVLNEKNNMVHYRGIIENDNHSVVAISISENGMMGLICNNEGNYVVGKMENDADGLHIIYNDKDLQAKPGFGCAANTNVPVNNIQKGTNTLQGVTKCINLYWEVDNDVYVNKGSLANVNTYIQGIFNQSAVLYANDSITVSLQTVFVWDTVDPYTGTTTSDYLNQFETYRTSYSGDVAVLIGYQGGGGIANLHGLCSSKLANRMGYCGVSSSYKTVPTYSWTIEVITHEQGHILGSPHTHDCKWSGTNIDACGQQAGYTGGSCNPQPTGPIPTSGGTIMSYCHLVNGVGINFANGFGPLPKALILNYINNASCLTACIGCATPAQPGVITGTTAVCQGSSQTYSIAAVTGATSYAWILPNGWTGSSSANSINVVTGSVSGNISVTAINSCGSSPVKTLAVSVSPFPSQPGIISGSTAICSGSSQTYSVSAVNGATSYSWTLPNGWTGSSSSNTINITAGSSGGNISVKAINTCGTSTAQTLAITISNTVAQPGQITGSTSVCQGSSQTYSVSAVNGATSYSWTLPNGWTGSSSSNTINITAGSSGGNISVKAINTCGTSTAQTLAITISNTVAQPGQITGSTSVCQGSSQTYSVSAVNGATSYSWTLPNGWTGSSSSNTINITAGSSGGNISVKAINTCGTSTAQTLAVTISTIIAQPGQITGSTSVCQGSSQTYSVNAVNGATSYTWTLPNGWSGSSTSNSITVIAGSTGGNISVVANSGCGSSSAQTLAVTISTIIAQPGQITGSVSVCEGSSQTYSVNAVNGATSYTWTLPNGWSGSSSANSITVTAGASGGSISVVANSGCGSSASQSVTIAVSKIPSQPGTILGNNVVCQNSSQIYSVNPISGATSYTWTLPNGWTGTSSSSQITVTAGSAGGNITVTAINNCGSSPAQSLSTNVSNVIAQPGLITGSVSVCENSSQTYSVNAVPGATGYTWTLPQGWTGSSTGNTITVIPGNAGGAITVVANNGCSSSTSQSLPVSVSPVPTTPARITGDQFICQGAIKLFSVNPVAGALSYKWTLPPGWMGSSTTNSISVTAGNSSGIIMVTAENNCGKSTTRAKFVLVSHVPDKPDTIYGNTSVCSNSVQKYSLKYNYNVRSYTWTLPNGWTGTSTSRSIFVKTGTTGGVVSVKAVNSCGTSTEQFLTVVVNPLPVVTLAQSGDYIVVSPVSSTDRIRWFYKNKPVTGSDDSLQCKGTGNYVSVVTNASGCVGEAPALNVTNCNGASKPDELSVGFSISPNPSTNIITITFNDDIVNPMVEISNSLGQLHFKKQFADNDHSSITIPVNGPPGIYLVRVSSGAKSRTQKLVIQQ